MKVKLYNILGTGLILWVLGWFVHYIFQNVPLGITALRFLRNLHAPFYTGNLVIFPWKALFFTVFVIVLCTLLGTFFIAKCIPSSRVSSLIWQGFVIGFAMTAFLWEQAAIFFLLNPFIITSSFLLIILLIFLIPPTAQEKKNLLEPGRWHAIDRLIIMFLVLMNGLILYWAVFFPVRYWDGLILYVRYARETFLMNGFPVRIALQVGDGLGANYPHLFEVFSAGIAVLNGSWDDVIVRIFPPLMGIATQIFIYCTARMIFHSSRLGLFAALLYRIIPYSIAYNIYASNYATAMAMTALFFYFLTAFYKTNLKGYFLLAGLTAGFAAHLNYLMLILPVFFLIFTGIILYGNRSLRSTKWVWLFVALSLTVSSTWYLRNVIVTGNPVYAFYPEIFGGKRINPDIVDFCFNEWQKNGDGIGNGRYGDSLPEKIRNSLYFWVLNPVTGWKVNPFLMAFFLPGFAIAIIKKQYKNPLISLFLLFIGALLFYHYCIAGLYLYHIIIMFPIAAIIAAYTFVYTKHIVHRILVTMLMITAIFPGLVFSLYGFKLTGVGEYRGQPVTAVELIRMPHPDRYYFWQWIYGDEAKMWKYVNENIRHRTILTHDNRYLCYNEDIRIVHLDDWDIQPVYDMQFIEEKAGHLKSMGLNYYLFIENEKNMVNSDGELLRDWIGIDDLIREGYLKEVFRPGSNGPVLYRFRFRVKDEEGELF